jgi:hypothetical protein
MTPHDDGTQKAPGRTCPTAYGYRAADLADAPELVAETLYVIGGLYGNLQALDAIEAMAARESGPVALVFNGDFHWFDIDPAAFARVETVVGDHRALRGNVETELANGPGEAGCGCAYPEWIDDDVVTRSNAIMERLAVTADALDGVRARLAGLPMFLRARVGRSCTATPSRWPAGASRRRWSTIRCSSRRSANGSRRPRSTCSPAATPACRSRSASTTAAAPVPWSTTARPECPTSAATCAA